MPMIVLLLPLADEVSFAVLCLPQNLQIGALKEVSQFDSADRKTADACGVDNTMTASAVEHRYAATGDMICANGDMAQASIIIKTDMIVTSAHVYTAKATGR